MISTCAKDTNVKKQTRVYEVGEAGGLLMESSDSSLSSSARMKNHRGLKFRVDFYK